MSEVTEIQIEDAEQPSRWDSFEHQVWTTLNLIDMTDYVSEKKVTVKPKDGKSGYTFTLNYISWVDAWQQLMNCFPQSHFEFDDPRFFDSGTGEQWVTVTVKQGAKEMTRRWWLPFMDQTNRAVERPSSTQINNTRMRVLVKCISMCGLGISVYGGEDVATEQQDATPVSGGSVRKSVLDGEEINPVAVRGYARAVNGMLGEDLVEFSATGSGKVKKINLENVDWAPITDLALEIGREGMLGVAVADELTSWRRSIMRTAMERYRDEKRAADEAAKEEE